jgi:hypothetical protein
MSRALGRPARYGPFGHLYLRTIMMILVSIVATSFAILLLFSLPSCHRLRAIPFSAEGVGAGASSLYSFDTNPDTDPRGRFTTCSHHRFRCHRTSCSSYRPSQCSSSPTYCLRPRSCSERTDARRCGYGASRSCSRPFSVRAARGRYSGACHA